MSNYYQNQQSYGQQSANNLQFFPSSYTPSGVSGAATPSPAFGGYGAPPAPAYGAGVSGRMGEQGGLRTGWLAAFSTEGYDGEPPLLEELGVNFAHIQAKTLSIERAIVLAKLMQVQTLAVLNPLGRIDQHLMDDSDLAGPVLFFLLFGTFLLFSGKVHFGYIYGLALLGSTSLHAILSLMTPPDSGPSPQYGGSSYHEGQSGPGGPGPNASSTLTFARSASVLGYCLLPLVATSLVGIVMPMDTPFGIILTSAAILWCTTSSSGIFCAVGRMRGMRALVAYPLALFYAGFGIMGVFSSRGSGSFARLQKV
ncbi:hypothetical protein jhhlp_002741 [Lomentospora prolificans]|uniref:Uncharacterized protein n=1 Tax=Lomentospora prolificans TaxID=41688 RepID=A0A2N3NF39_9PEZI|nr:hypothetical protein jhhlp_002741 [Lomentospora prolificans]